MMLRTSGYGRNIQPDEPAKASSSSNSTSPSETDDDNYDGAVSSASSYTEDSAEQDTGARYDYMSRVRSLQGLGHDSLLAYTLDTPVYDVKGDLVLQRSLRISIDGLECWKLRWRISLTILRCAFKYGY